MTAVQRPAVLRGAAAAGACALLAGCVVTPFGEAKVDPASPVAAEVARTARTDAAYPRFADIPKRPNDLPPPASWGRKADQLEAARARVEAATTPDSWTLQSTDAFAGAARAAAGPDVAPAEQVDTEAFAEALRKRATPPPPPRR